MKMILAFAVAIIGIIIFFFIAAIFDRIDIYIKHKINTDNENFEEEEEL